MKSNKRVYFDIETTGFCSQDQFILAATHTQETNIHYRLEHLEESIKELNPDWLIITYNGENYYGGFDIPFLRALCIKEGRDWFLRGKRDLDLYPLVKKFLNTKAKSICIPSKSEIILKKGPDESPSAAEWDGV